MPRCGNCGLRFQIKTVERLRIRGLRLGYVCPNCAQTSFVCLKDAASGLRMTIDQVKKIRNQLLENQ